MTIPKMSAKHILAAIHEIDFNGFPSSRGSRRYQLSHKGRFYPPKYVVSLAAKFATGDELSPDLFSGGTETNSFLSRQGFSIVELPDSRSRLGFSNNTNLTETQNKPVESKLESYSLIGRVVTRGQTKTSRDAEQQLLNALTDTWPARTRVKFLITPGGFVSSELPEVWKGGISWASSTRDFQLLRTYAESVLCRVLTKRVLRLAKGKTDVITVGIDLFDPAYPTHVEMIAVFQIGTGQTYWTGKSYPTMEQENTLIQATDLRSHLLRIAGERVLVLGCHDLNMFSARTLTNCNEGSIRHQRCTNMLRLTTQFNPTIVLQHPHTTDSPRIWSTAWSGVRSHCPELKAWASGIDYANHRQPPRTRLEDVLTGTRSQSEVVDIIVQNPPKLPC